MAVAAVAALFVMFNSIVGAEAADMEPEPLAACDQHGDQSLWVTRMVLAAEAAAAAAAAGGAAVAGGRRSNPRGKRTWPVCPTPAHEAALRLALARAAGGVAADSIKLELMGRYALATFGTAEAAAAAGERLE